MKTWMGQLAFYSVLVSLAAALYSAVGWGLPSSEADQYLFASTQPWSGSELAKFDPIRQSTTRASDVDANPIDQSQGPVVLNQTNAQRAEIIRRYKLFSHQPDEMQTFMALAEMRPSNLELDPKSYKYGGLWIYPVGALLKIADLTGLAPLSSNKQDYYNNPSLFGRFYLVARCYTIFWTLVGVAAVGFYVLRITSNDLAAVCASATVAATPVVLGLSLEAKPHLPGAVLMFLAVYAATHFVHTGRTYWAMGAGILCGAAGSMVLTGWISFIIIPFMVFARPLTFNRRSGLLFGSLGAGLLTYAIFNPYVIIHLIGDQSLLFSNLQNSAHFYNISFTDSLQHAIQLLIEAASPVTLSLSLLATIVLPILCLFKKSRFKATAWLIAIPTLVSLMQFIILSRGQPSDYGRFAIFPCVTFAIASIILIVKINVIWLRSLLIVAIPIATWILYGSSYLQAALQDTQPNNTRQQAAIYIDTLNKPQGATLQIYNEPAPYNMPPIDLWRWNLLLTKPTNQPTGDVILLPIDNPTQTAQIPTGYKRMIFASNTRPATITWANKPFMVLVKQ